tara:strand:+ start:9195 stop:10259 length:1065 start_codon:yes stop_codon:yes gene_type:complete
MNSPTKIPYIATTDSVTVMIKGVPKTLAKGHENFEELKKLLSQQEVNPITENDVISLVDITTQVNKVSGVINSAYSSTGDFKLEVDTNKGKVIASVKGFVYPLPKNVSIQIMELAKKNDSIAALAEFVKNLMDNPDMEIAADLFDFLDSCKMALTPDGCFLAYKKIRDNWKDSHTGTIDNSIGSYVSMPRWAVKRDRNQTCSTGLHVASYDYSLSFSGTRHVIVKVNPKDVVSVPIDYNNEKMRVCAYQVIREVGNEQLRSEVYEEAMEAPVTHTRITPNESGNGNKSVKTNKSSDKRTQKKTAKKKAAVGKKGNVPHNKKYNSDRERMDARNARRRELRAQKHKASEAKSTVK